MRDKFLMIVVNACRVQGCTDIPDQSVQTLIALQSCPNQVTKAPKFRRGKAKGLKLYSR